MWERAVGGLHPLKITELIGILATLGTEAKLGTRKMREQPHFQIYAASAARRARIAELVRRNAKQASIVCVASLSQPEGDTLPDVSIADLETPSSATALLKASADWPGGLGLVVLIDDPDPRWVRAAIDAGVNAIIARMPDPEELRLAIEAAEAGMVILHPSSARELSAGSLVSEPDFEESEHLTAREREVLLLIGEGLGNKQIAARLGISEHTAKFHISSILGKLSVSSRAEAVSQGIRR